MLKLVNVIATDSSVKAIREKVKHVATIAAFYPLIKLCDYLEKSKGDNPKV